MCWICTTARYQCTSAKQTRVLPPAKPCLSEYFDKYWFMGTFYCIKNIKTETKYWIYVPLTGTSVPVQNEHVSCHWPNPAVWASCQMETAPDMWPAFIYISHSLSLVGWLDKRTPHLGCPCSRCVDGNLSLYFFLCLCLCLIRLEDTSPWLPLFKMCG